MKTQKTLQPLRGYCLIKLLDESQTTDSGLVLPDISKDRQAKGEILSVGLEGTNEFRFMEWEVKKGDVVWFKRYAGEEIKDKGEKLMLVHYKDLLGVYK